MDAAMHRALKGKGRERHNPHNLRFEDQPIMAIQRAVGIGYPLGQIMKKAQEVTALESNQQKVEELLDIIVYAAATVMWLEELDR